MFTFPRLRSTLLFSLAVLFLGAAAQAMHAAPVQPDAPTVSNVQGMAEPGGKYVISGRVSNFQPGTVIHFTGIDPVNGETAQVDENGNFYFVAVIPGGQGGDVGIQAVTPSGEQSGIVLFSVP